jgi:TM2 domain-containing membrane protein YozV
MKVSYKAALLSTFVFPGVGQLYLKRYWRGLVIMVVVFTGLGYMIWSATVSALNRLDDVMVKVQGSTTNLQELSGIVGSKMLATDPYLDAVFYAMVCLWIFAIIDAYRIGKQREFQDEETSEW